MIDQLEFKRRLQDVVAPDGGLRDLSLEDALRIIPRVDEIEGEPAHSTVLIRADLDSPVQDGRVSDMSRIHSSRKTLEHCLGKGWKIVMTGHIGRDPENSLKPVCQAMSDVLKTPIEFFDSWLDTHEDRLLDNVVERIRSAPPKSVFMLENTRKYEIERILWSMKEVDAPRIFDRLYAIAADLRSRLTDMEINEAIAASNMDFSSAVVPLAMRYTAMGFFIDDEMKIRIPAARKARFVVFSGLKMDKLNDLEAIIASRPLDVAMVGGSLAMPLVKARARIAGGDFHLGLAETDTSLKAYVPPQRVEQAERIVKLCEERGVDLRLPEDFVLDTGEVSREIPAGRAQLDIGPETTESFRASVREYIAQVKSSGRKVTMFYNGALGKMEDPRFENGTKSFIPLLREMTDAGIETYVGGGEGRMALLRYGSLDHVSHAFTSGGTVLKCLGNRPIGYLNAMYLQNSLSEKARLEA